MPLHGFRHFMVLGLLLPQTSWAVDRIVEEFAVAPNYSSISAAVSAAVDGDRIVIKNRSGGQPWSESVIINKDLQFLSYTGNTQFLVLGDWSVQVATGRKVVINGMYNQQGGVFRSGNGTERGTHVSIIGCHFTDGSVSFDDPSCELDLLATTVEHGIVRLSYGSVVGCTIITNFSAPLSIQGSTGVYYDTCSVIGNKLLNNNYGGSSSDGLRIQPAGQVMHVRNNFIRCPGTAIEVNDSGASGMENRIWNNTLLLAGSASPVYTGVELGELSAGTMWDLRNNLIVDQTSNGTSRGIHAFTATTGTVTVLYNHLSELNEPITNGFTLVGYNTTTGITSVDFDNGTVGVPSASIDGADPDPAFTDLDLSPGDVGAYGGSYTLTNFFPAQVNGARITQVVFPHAIREGTNLRLRAVAIDR